MTKLVRFISLALFIVSGSGLLSCSSTQELYELELNAIDGETSSTSKKVSVNDYDKIWVRRILPYGNELLVSDSESEQQQRILSDARSKISSPVFIGNNRFAVYCLSRRSGAMIVLQDIQTGGRKKIKTLTNAPESIEVAISDDFVALSDTRGNVQNIDIGKYMDEFKPDKENFDKIDYDDVFIEFRPEDIIQPPPVETIEYTR